MMRTSTQSSGAVRRPGFFTKRNVILWLLSMATMIVGLYCMYRAMLPLYTLYANALNEPLGDWTEKYRPEDLKGEVWRWAIPGGVFLMLSSVLGVVVAIGWRRAIVSRISTSLRPANPPSTPRRS